MSALDDEDSISSVISLFRTIEEKGKYVGRTNVLHSVVLVGKISPHVTDHQAVGNYFEAIALKFSPPDHVTGLLMVYPYHVIHIIESSFRTLLKIFRAMNESEKIIEWYMKPYTELGDIDLKSDDKRKPFGGFDESTIKTELKKHALGPTIHNRIICAIDNVTNRIFRTYEVLIFDMEPTIISDYDSNESDSKKLLNLLIQVTRLSIYLAEEPMKGQKEYVPEIFKRKLNEILNNIRQAHPELIPQQVAVGYFADISSYEGIIPLQEYMDLYDLPYETTIQSELTWPIHGNKYFYT
ncbi:unnamed protein product [Heterobilharzia americana]|nr:unnamed protein product [Heterobilharzia americana]